MSSTLEELADERESAREAIEQLLEAFAVLTSHFESDYLGCHRNFFQLRSDGLSVDRLAR